MIRKWFTKFQLSRIMRRTPQVGEPGYVCMAHRFAAQVSGAKVTSCQCAPPIA